MIKRKGIPLDFEIDKLTNSIENVISGESFSTEVLPLTKQDLSQLTKKRGWLFEWKKELFEVDKKVFKLVTIENIHIIQGLISLRVMPDY